MSFYLESNSQLEQLQEVIADRLQGREALTQRLAVVTQKNGSLQKQLDEALLSLGACCIIFPPTGTITHPNVAGPWFGEVIVQARVVVNPDEHKGESALYYAEEILRALHLWDPSMPGTQVIVAQSNRPNPEPVDHVERSIIDVYFTNEMGLTPDVNR